MHLIDRLAKPEYLYQPARLVRRLLGGYPKGQAVPQTLPWDLRIVVNPNDNIGSQVVVLGVFDLLVSEVLWRLCARGETAMDIGANIGCMASVLAARVGPAGRLLCFEPHPVLAAELRQNVALWTESPVATIEVREIGLSSEAGTMPLQVPEDFDRQRGQSSLEPSLVGGVPLSTHHMDVCVETLDQQLLADERVGIIKIDVEGHELDAVTGGRRVFQEHRVRDVVFEEHRNYPTPVTDVFERHGYSVLRLHRRFRGPELLPANSPIARSDWEATSFLATVDPDRAAARLAPRGWWCLKNRHPD